MRVVIELNGIRYKSVIKRKPTDCSYCDLKKYICEKKTKDWKDIHQKE